jgi:FlaG/FlaF family flagellin (archaellin)
VTTTAAFSMVAICATMILAAVVLGFVLGARDQKLSDEKADEALEEIRRLLDQAADED